MKDPNRSIDDGKDGGNNQELPKNRNNLVLMVIFILGLFLSMLSFCLLVLPYPMNGFHNDRNLQKHVFIAAFAVAALIALGAVLKLALNIKDKKR